MELQYNKNYSTINKFGCYFISLGVWAEEIAEKKTTPEDVLNVFADVVFKKYMNYKCYISNPEMVLNCFLNTLGSKIRVEYIGWWNEDTGTEFWNNNSEEDIAFEILRSKTPTGHHFYTAGFDPGPKFKRSPEINGRRYFEVKR